MTYDLQELVEGLERARELRAIFERLDSPKEHLEAMDNAIGHFSAKIEEVQEDTSN